MAALRLGPLLRYVDGTSATVWVETDGPCRVEVVCGPADGAGAAGGPVTADASAGPAGTPPATGPDSGPDSGPDHPGTGPEGGRTGAGRTGGAAGRPAAPEDTAGAGGAGGRAHTWQVAGHHYALVTVAGLRPGTSTAYRVLLDGRQVWPQAGSGQPPSTIRTLPDPPEEAALRVAFGSCRWAAPPSVSSPGSLDPDALDTLAEQIGRDPAADRPDVLLLLGDQVYADETSQATRAWLATRRDLSEPPWDQVADYEEYTRLYEESWLDPEVRWLLSTVPSCMVFDDHDVIDDWNTSQAWRDGVRATSWWHERVVSGLMSYWVYQHLGNLSPAELAEDPLFAAVRERGDGTEVLREYAERADADPKAARWSYRRDLGRVRILIVDSRAGRVLDPGARAMLDADEMAWLRDQVLTAPGSCDHVLIGSSLPWLLPPAVHDAETWNAAVCAGSRGPRWVRIGEKVRQAADLEHWAAFPASFEALGELLARAGGAPDAPATICVLSGDVHHAYVAEPVRRDRRRPGTRDGGAGAPGAPGEGGAGSRVLQLTCSPVHNSMPAFMRLGFRFGWSRAGRWLGRALTRHGRADRSPVDCRRLGGPWFGNQLMTLTLRGRQARLRLDQVRRDRDGEVRLTAALDAPVRPAADRGPDRKGPGTGV